MIITVDDPSIAWSRLGPQADKKKILLIQEGTERVVGATSEEIKLVESGGGTALQRTQTLDSAELGNRVCATVMLRSTFRPISHLDQDGERTISIRYDGYAAKMQVYSAAAGQVMWVSLQVSGIEKAPAGAGKETDAWIVEADYGDNRLRYWIGAKSPELLKQSSSLADGMVIQFVR